MQRQSVQLANEAATLRLGAAIGAALRAGDIVALEGDLGAGKTTLARGILAGAGHEGEVPSPTFTIVQAYLPPSVRLPVWHCDLYRIESPGEVEELGLDEALDDGALIVEWPDRAGPRLMRGALRLRLDIDDGARRLTAEVPPAWESRWPK